MQDGDANGDVTNGNQPRLSNVLETGARWFLFEYQGRELVILSKPFKTKKLAEKARLKYSDRVRRKIGIGVVRVPAIR
jgi:hypothetical protein